MRKESTTIQKCNSRLTALGLNSCLLYTSPAGFGGIHGAGAGLGAGLLSDPDAGRRADGQRITRVRRIVQHEFFGYCPKMCIRDRDKAEWNMRMAYGYQYLYGQEEKAIPYAQRWAESVSYTHLVFFLLGVLLIVVSIWGFVLKLK